ncbi:hypothetical protein NHX12_008449 [Muraenolepis orangiensis]|uniref:Uncharacterized protein n=1 Tax=Muraenolepis orangiensis TaxID=630683 RepID=A0A9Q0DLD0_9TELE|nr:hypothetical protein NHX12_008449 [Muraenolepis orangiensis]
MSRSRAPRSPTPPPTEPLTRDSSNSSQHSNNVAVIASDEHGSGSPPNSAPREPLVSVRTALQNTGGDLTAAEAACAEEAADGATGDTNPDLELPCTSRVATKRSLDSADRAAVEALQKKVTDSTDLLKELAAKPKDQPTNEREVFGQYVHNSLLTMSKARLMVINKLLTVHGGR